MLPDSQEGISVLQGGEDVNQLKSWVIASVLSLEVVFVLILSEVLLHEHALPMQLVGAVIVLGATVGINLVGERKE